MFTNKLGKPLDVNELSQRIIKPTLQTAHIEWHGGTLSDAGLRLTFIFHRLGVDDQRIQASLWHCTLAVTQTRTRPCLLICPSNAAARQCDFVLRPFSGSGAVAGELSGLSETSH